MSAPFHDHFSNIAARYADFRPHYPPELFDYLASLVPHDAGVWDCAAGNGQATVDLAGRFNRIIATDASRDQIASSKPMPNVTFRVAPAEESGLPNHSVGLVTVAQAVHWFDFNKFYSEVRRVLKPGGVLAVWAYGILQLDVAEPDRIAQHFYAEVVGPYWPPERQWVEEGYRTIPFPFQEIEPPAFHMETLWTLEQLLGYFSTWSATNRCIKATGQNPVEPLSHELARAWGDASIPRRITWPLSIRVGRS